MIVNLSSTSMSATYYKQGRLIVRKTSTSAPMRFWSNLQGSYDSPIAEYAQTSGNVVEIDVTDYVRAYASTLTSLKFRATNSSTTYTLNITIKGLINPASVIIPPHDYMDYALIVPPFKLIEPGNDFSPIRYEFYSLNAGTFTRDEYDQNGDLYNTITQPKQSSSSLDDTIDSKFYIENDQDGDGIWRFIKPQMCDRRYANVRWLSFTGQERIHVFEVVKVKTESADNYSLLPTDNEYIDIKGRVDSFVLRLDGLCAYDIWYYSDLITSSKVEVSLDGTTYTRVQVTDKSITLPDGEAQDGKLEINVNWKRYDAVAM